MPDDVRRMAKAGGLALGMAFFVCVLGGRARAQTYIAGQTYLGRSNYTAYIAGDLPVIFSAPHGGSLTPAEIPDRVDDGSDPDFATVTDSNTEELALAMQQVFCNYFGHSPHIIICQLKRTKIDCNRSLSQGVYQTNVFATQAWNEFQNFINSGSNAAVAESPRGFYIDLHGQGHAIQRLELGYLLTASQLTNVDAVLDQSTYAHQSSERSLAGLVSANQGISFSQLLRGSNSFGGLMVARGYPSVPSPDMPNPGNGTNPIVYPGTQNPYFDGGYNTAVHASQSAGGPIDGLQIEANFTGVRDTAVNRTNFAIAIAQIMDFYFTNYYGMDLRLAAPCQWNGGGGNWGTAGNWQVALPVSGNYLQFSGPGGAARNNLAALTTGTGTVYSLLFGTNASGSYTLYGNAVSLSAGVTNFSALTQTVSNAVTLRSNQTFSALSGPLVCIGAVTNAGYNLTLAATANLTMNGVISGAGGLLKSGGGSLVLASSNTYSGTTTNLSGTLIVSNKNGSATGSGAVFINPGTTLTGTGTVGGPVTILGTVAPGSPIGMLTVTNGLNISGGVYNWTLAANSTNSAGVNFDQIALTGGNLTAGGSSILAISFTNTATTPATNNAFWQAPHSWKIISLTSPAANPGSNSFATVSNGSFTAGKFLTSVDAQGSVQLNFVPTPQPLISSALPGAGTTNVTVSWSAVAGINYQVQYTTNLVPPNWQPLGTVPANSTNASYQDSSPVTTQRFYRIIIP